ncbi:2Fe-2S iron-sulfur cluster-binding protein [Undibacterium sp. Ji42W]|uniref:2Fe-2S iron-sulfur cluster-binding protein n=1 Tax=Undibacterium sp. Ji42W TaxID=3413039 RepID=UPI003BEFD2AD
MREQDPGTGKIAKIWINGSSFEATTDMSVVAALMRYDNMQTRQSVSGQPRFAVCGMGICQECRVRINGQSHKLACQEYCRSGMVINTETAGLGV